MNRNKAIPAVMKMSMFVASNVFAGFQEEQTHSHRHEPERKHGREPNLKVHW
jgi:hypothetical protein